jgi:hypothetical protein
MFIARAFGIAASGMTRVRSCDDASLNAPAHLPIQRLMRADFVALLEAARGALTVARCPHRHAALHRRSDLAPAEQSRIERRAEHTRQHRKHRRQRRGAADATDPGVVSNRSRTLAIASNRDRR